MKGLCRWHGRKVALLAAILAVCLFSSACSISRLGAGEENQTDEIVTLVIENMGFREELPDLNLVEERINEKTIPEIGCRIQIKNCRISQHSNLVQSAALGKIQVDIVGTAMGTSLSELAADGTIFPLDEWLAPYEDTLKKKIKDTLPATSIDDHIYAVSAVLYPGYAMGIGYNQHLAEECGLSFPETIQLETLTEIGRKMKQKRPDLYLAAFGSDGMSAFDSFYDVESFGGHFAYGGILYPLENSDIINIYETEEYRAYCHTMRQWTKEGLMPPDSLTSGVHASSLFNQEKILLQWSSVSPDTELLILKKQLPFEEKLIAITPSRASTPEVQEYAWGICATCRHPEKAMAFLDLLYRDAELANLITYGIEGIHYEKTGAETIRPLKGPDGLIGYETYFSHFGDPALLYHYGDGNEPSVQDVLSFSARAEKDPSFGYTFQTKGLEARITAIEEVTERYRTVLEAGMASDVDQTLKEFHEALKEAGMDLVIEENRRQFARWMEKLDSGMSESDR